MKFEQLILIILDGLGVASASEGNAVSQAVPKNLDYLINHFPSLVIQASGPSVGLPWGEPGNSEVGHLNMGAGRIISQDLQRISSSIAKGTFYQNAAILKAIEHVKQKHSSLHLMGLLSSGGVHSLEEHLYSLLEMAGRNQLERVFVHIFSDGRDTAPQAILESLDKLNRKFLELGVGKVASITGRFYAMDRAKHWEVTEKTYRCLVDGEGEKSPSVPDAIRQYYDRQIYDETFPPTLITETDGRPVGLIGDGDSVIFFNFRPDRALQLTQAFVDPTFKDFATQRVLLHDLLFVTMTEYGKMLPVEVAFPYIEIKNGLGEILSANEKRQYRAAESEKYAHITSFFNGGRLDPWPGELREIVSSPTSYERRYENVPEMSVDLVAKNVVEKISQGFDFIATNFANPDMVAHTGNLDASIAAIRAVDKSIGYIFSASMKAGACLIITADHGNIEEVLDLRTGRMNKEHSLNPVPFIVCAPGLQLKKPHKDGYLELAPLVPEGVLSDIAPTILELMGIPKPTEMTAISLLPNILKKQARET